MNSKIIIFLLLILSFGSQAEIKEIKSLQEINKELEDPELLWVFDIDNTIIRPEGNLGSDQWYYFLVDHIKNIDKISTSKAHYQAEAIWNATQSLIKTKSVEPITASFITSLQNNKKNTIALTARNFSICEITKTQLKNNGINFNISSPQFDNNILEIANGVYYHEGIIYQGEANNKGQILVDFIGQLKAPPKKVIFIDDKEKNVINVHKALEALGIDHIEFRYGQTDKLVEMFNSMSREN